MVEKDATQSNTIVDRFNREKLYIQLMRIFLDEINSGRWQLKQQIPSESELCTTYEVSKITVRQAINNLVSDGYLIKIQGKGTFVTSVIPQLGLAMRTRLTEEMFGEEVKLERKPLFKGIVEPADEIRGYLKTDDRVFKMLSIRTADGRAAYLEEAFVPHALLPSAEKLDVPPGSLYAFLQEKGVKKIFKMIQTIEVAMAGRDTSINLEMNEGEPVLVVHRLFCSSDNTPVAYTKIQGRTDRYKFQTEFERIR